MKKLLVSQRIIFHEKTKTYRDALDQELVDFFYKNNFILIPIPNLNLSKKKIGIFLKDLIKSFTIKGIVLSGGNDIKEYSSRDLVEKSLLDISKRKNIPVFGICRGMQIMADFYSIKLKKIKGHVGTRHLVYNEKNKSTRMVNSFHNWSIMNVSNNFEILHKAKDKSIEAFRDKKFRWEACMWHPEREKIYHKDDCQKIKNLWLQIFRPSD